MTPSEKIQQLNELNQAYKDGLVSKEECDRLKNEIIGNNKTKNDNGIMEKRNLDSSFDSDKIVKGKNKRAKNPLKIIAIELVIILMLGAMVLVSTIYYKERISNDIETSESVAIRDASTNAEHDDIEEFGNLGDDGKSEDISEEITTISNIDDSDTDSNADNVLNNEDTNTSIKVVINYEDMTMQPTFTEDFKINDYVLLYQNNNGNDFDKYYDKDGNVVMVRWHYVGGTTYSIYNDMGSYGFEIYIEPDSMGFHNEELYGFEVNVYKDDKLIFSGNDEDYEYKNRYPTGLWTWGIRIEGGNVTYFN